MEHDHHVGQLLDKLDKLGITDNTIVIYSTDNGAQTNTYPDGGMEPFRGEKGSTWEGGFRVPAVVRWPGTVKPGTKFGEIMSHEASESPLEIDRLLRALLPHLAAKDVAKVAAEATGLKRNDLYARVLQLKGQ